MFNFEYGAINLILEAVVPPAARAVALRSDVGVRGADPDEHLARLPVHDGGRARRLTSIPVELRKTRGPRRRERLGEVHERDAPSLMPVLIPGILLGTIWTFNNTLVVWLVSNGGQPTDATHILVTYIYKVAFTYSRYSYAAAFSVVVFLMLLGFVVYVMRRHVLAGAYGMKKPDHAWTPGRVFVQVFLILFAIATVYPILQIVTISLRPSDQLYSTSLAIIPGALRCAPTGRCCSRSRSCCGCATR